MTYLDSKGQVEIPANYDPHILPSSLEIAEGEVLNTIFEDSFVAIYHGSRRGGKTLSMTFDSSQDMHSGRTCYSNYPIAWQEVGYNGRHYFYESLPLVEDELLYIDKPEIKAKYSNASIAWDEGSLSLFSRDFMSARNRMIGLVVTLIGKLEMNFYFTVQFLSLLDKNVKLQMDALLFCRDLSFKHKQYKRGAYIGQAVQDISGRFTGEMYEHSERVYYQTLHGEDFWTIYDTKNTFPVLQNRVKMGDIRAGMGHGEMTDEDEQATQAFIMKNLILELQATGQSRMTQPILFELAKERGFVGRAAQMGVHLIKLGAENKATGAGNLWIFDTAGERASVYG